MGRVLRYQTAQLWFTEWTCREPALDTMQTRRHQSSGAATNIGEGWILQEKNKFEPRHIGTNTSETPNHVDTNHLQPYLRISPHTCAALASLASSEWDLEQ